MTSRTILTTVLFGLVDQYIGCGDGVEKKEQRSTTEADAITVFSNGGRGDEITIFPHGGGRRAGLCVGCS